VAKAKSKLKKFGSAMAKVLAVSREQLRDREDKWKSRVPHFSAVFAGWQTFRAGRVANPSARHRSEPVHD
jgi:hypothetical protein